MADFVLIGWISGPPLAAEFGISPSSDDYFISVKELDEQGGLRPEFVDRVVPVYAKQGDIDRAV